MQKPPEGGSRARASKLPGGVIYNYKHGGTVVQALQVPLGVPQCTEWALYGCVFVFMLPAGLRLSAKLSQQDTLPFASVAIRNTVDTPWGRVAELVGFVGRQVHGHSVRKVELGAWTLELQRFLPPLDRLS